MTDKEQKEIHEDILLELGMKLDQSSKIGSRIMKTKSNKK